MRTTDAYAALRALGQPVVETRDAAAVLHASPNRTTQLLRTVERAGLIRQVRRGLWAIDLDVAPAVLAPYLTAPYPSYVSLFSALAQHGMIEQIPARTEIVSLDRARTVQTPMGTFSIHRIAPEVFTGFQGSPEVGYVAGPEKALFDVVYTRAPRGGVVRFPELVLTDDFDRARLDEWTKRIPRPRLRTLVARGINAALRQADELAAYAY
jgi:predicted transcriptional regulator of viral defense system